jgi:hypothetical protein
MLLLRNWSVGEQVCGFSDKKFPTLLEVGRMAWFWIISIAANFAEFN